jgi:hypothetical protein
MVGINWKSELEREGHRVVLSGEPIAINSHYYNIYFQKMLEDNFAAEGAKIIYQAAEKASYTGFLSFIKQYRRLKTAKYKHEIAILIFRNCGLGVIHFQDINEQGGRIVTPVNHYAIGWLTIYGKRETCGCHFVRGWIAGVLEVIYNQPLGTYLVGEAECKMRGAKQCVFQISKGED